MPLPFPIPEDQQTTFVVDAEWWLKDPDSLEVEVHQRVSENETSIKTPKAVVDLVTAKLSTGHFQADLSALTDPGRYFLRWYATVEPGGVEEIWDAADFEVLANGSGVNLPGPNYALVSDLRDEGVALALLSDARALRALHRASRFVESFTGRTFGAEAKQLNVDEFSGNGAVLLEQPIVALSKVTLINVDVDSDVGTDIERDLIRVYNRHLKARMRRPDDREDPRVELRWDTIGLTPEVPFVVRRAHRWPLGRQDIRFEGAFGYTDPDGSPMGRVPDLIRHATVLLAIRESAQAFDVGGRASTRALALRMEKTRDQAVQYETGGGTIGTPMVGAFTGDPEIDTILALYSRGPQFGAA